MFCPEIYPASLCLCTCDLLPFHHILLHPETIVSRKGILPEVIFTNMVPTCDSLEFSEVAHNLSDELDSSDDDDDELIIHDKSSDIDAELIPNFYLNDVDLAFIISLMQEKRARSKSPVTSDSTVDAAKSLPAVSAASAVEPDHVPAAAGAAVDAVSGVAQTDPDLSDFLQINYNALPELYKTTDIMARDTLYVNRLPLQLQLSQIKLYSAMQFAHDLFRCSLAIMCGKETARVKFVMGHTLSCPVDLSPGLNIFSWA